MKTPSIRLRCSLAVASLALLQCSAASDKGGSAIDPHPTTGGASATAGASNTLAGAANGNGGSSGNGVIVPDVGGSGGSGGATTADDCTDASKLVYVASDKNELYSFAPDKLLFSKLGAIDCGSKTVNSMAVDRSGTAWVNFSDGKLYKLDIATLACTPTTFVAQQAGFTKVLGMGFSANSAGATDETLFVSDNNGKGLAQIDLSTLTLSPLGAYTGSLAGSDAELTGTGDGRLFGFFTTAPAHFAALDKATGATPVATLLPTVDASTGGFAFSFWGGDFWFYTAKDTPSTSVTHYVSATGMASVVLPDIGFTIVGAGVSTCAPVEPPPPPK